MNIVEEYKRLASGVMTKENFSYFLGIAKELSINYSQSRKDNVTTEKIPNKVGNENKTKWNELYGFEQAFLVLFYHRYINMLNNTKTPVEMGKTNKFLVSAHYQPSSKKITYDLSKIIEDKSENYANVMELCFHENRHAIQHKSFESHELVDLLQYDSNSIFILKDYIALSGNGIYQQNHGNSLMEIDANLYARALSSQLINSKFQEHCTDLDSTDFAIKEDMTGNPFEELDKTGIIGGQYVLKNGKTVDRGIMMDKNLKSMITPELVTQYPILNLIWQNRKFKSYSEIITDRTLLLQQCSSKKSYRDSSDNYEENNISDFDKIGRIYDSIIRSDPMLYLEDLLSRKQIQESKVISLFTQHPTLMQEYTADISEIFFRKSNEIDKKQETVLKKIAKQLNINISNPIIQSGVKATEEQTKTSQINAEIDNIHQQEEQNKSLADLDEFIEFIDPVLIQDKRFMETLRKYKNSHAELMSAEEYVEWVEEGYRKTLEGEHSEKVDKIDDERID